MSNIKVIKSKASDVDLLVSISRDTFTETFASFNSEENMKQYLEAEFSKSKLAMELQNAFSEFYFVSFDKQVVAYLKLNFGPAQTELQDERSMEIERIYVLKEFQRKNLGQLLFNKAFEIARRRNIEYIWLGVWEENRRAIQFYKKNGFVAFDKHFFKLGFDTQTDIMMKLDVRSNNPD